MARHRGNEGMGTRQEPAALERLPHNLLAAFEDYRSGTIDLDRLRQTLEVSLARDPDTASLVEDFLQERLGRRELDAGACHALLTALEDLGSEDVSTDWSTDVATRDTVVQGPAPAATAINPQETARFAGAGTVLKDRFVLGDRLGGGPMGQIHAVRDLAQPATSADAPLAVKLVPNVPGSMALEGLLREATLARRLSHPNIVRVHDIDRDADHAFMTMERLDGESLAKILDARRLRPMPRVQALQVVEGLCRALAHAHGLGIVHGDVKPGNIFVTSDGHARLLDFGAARDLNAADTARRGHTPEYASSEVIEGSPAMPADDLYSAACVAYRMLAGRRPYGRLNALEAREAGAAPERIDALTATQWRALEQALSHRREARQPDVTTFIAQLKGPREELARAGADARESAGPTVDEPPARPFLKRPAVLAGLAAGTAFAAVLAIALRPAAQPGTPGAAPAVPATAGTAAGTDGGVFGPPPGDDLSRLDFAPDLSGAIAAPEPRAAAAAPDRPARDSAAGPASGAAATPASAARGGPGPVAGSDGPDRTQQNTPAADAPPATDTVPKGPPVPDDAVAGAVAPGDEWPYPPLPPAFAAANPAAVQASGRSGATADTAGPGAADEPGIETGELPFGDLELRRYVEPDYPPLQANREIPGWVEVGFTVTRHGRTADAAVLRADPPGDFDTAALMAVRRWRFAPPAGGEDVRTRVRVRFTPAE